MYETIKIDVGRTNIVQMALGFDVSGDTFVCQIREEPNVLSTLIAAMTVTFKTDGVDGELVLKLDNSVSAGIARRTGYLDVKRTSGGEPLSVLDDPIQVIFEGVVTT